MSTWGIIVAAGSGTRFGGAKQFSDLAGRPVIEWSVEAARSVADGIVVVVANPQDERVLKLEVDKVVKGGATRSGSVRSGLAAVPTDASIIVVHDAARPLASEELFQGVTRAVRGGAAGAVPGVPVVDTIKRIDSTSGAPVVVETVDRSSLVSVQTPQAFEAHALRSAHSEIPDASDDARLVEQLGERVVVVAGDPINVKVTVPLDLEIVRMWATR